MLRTATTATRPCRAQNGRTALHWAAGRGKGDVVDVLLELGADLDARDRSNDAPVDCADDMGHDEVAGRLRRETSWRRRRHLALWQRALSTAYGRGAAE